MKYDEVAINVTISCKYIAGDYCANPESPVSFDCPKDCKHYIPVNEGLIGGFMRGLRRLINNPSLP